MAKFNEIFSVSNAVSLGQDVKDSDIKFTWIPTSGSHLNDKATSGSKISYKSDDDRGDGFVTMSEIILDHPTGNDVSSTDDVTPTKRPWHYLCFCRRDLLAVKIFYFAFMGALGVALPYCAVFLKQLGLSAFQIGIISGIRPVLGFVSGPLWGSIADRFSIRRAMMVVSVLAWLGFFVALYFIPNPARLNYCPADMNPHLVSLRVRRSSDNNSSFQSAAGTNLSHEVNSTQDGVSGSGLHWTDKEQELLRENLYWLYEPSSLYWTFITCLLVICGGELFQSPTTALSDAATLQILGRDDIHQYGAQRAWGPIGWAISSLAVGGFVTLTRSAETVCGVDIVFSDYRILAYNFMAIMVIGFVAAMLIDFAKDANAARGRSISKVTHSTLAVVKVFCNVHYGSWILTAFYVGFCNGVIWGFLFWHLDNLGGTQLLMGVDSVVACLCEFVAFFFVDHGIRWLGHMGIMYIGLIGYGVRFAVYASITNPWVVLPADALQGVTFSFIWVSLTAYTAVAVPTVSLATIQGIMHGVFFGLGNGLGHLIGGISIEAFGAVATFYSLSVVCGIWLVAFFICQKFSKKPKFDQFQYHNMDTEVGDTVTTAAAAPDATDAAAEFGQAR